MTTKKCTKKSDASAKVFSLLILTFGLFWLTSLPSPFLKLSSNARGNNACAALPWVSVLQPAYCNMHSTAQETPALASLPQWANGTHSLVPTSYNQYLQRGVSCHFRIFYTFPVQGYFSNLIWLNRHKLWCPLESVPFNYSSLSYIALAMTSALTWLSFSMTFQDGQLNS